MTPAGPGQSPVPETQICARPKTNAKGPAVTQNGGSSVTGDQEFLTEGDDVIGSPRQPDSARDRAGLGRSVTSAFAGGRCRSALTPQQVADGGHDFGHDAEMAVVIEDDQVRA